ncbi:hypothetical protein PoB_001544900 [Plakobranchus ocellatus]|uniref:Uncharacterized protein n=1 Tax=Plakobranchus ocellatus TaxID=259542 RepID=A0AAV3Z4K9_9GAST|nr:hypothetical protein PoB_001544900 [Plakobranchus ocellatus]
MLSGIEVLLHPSAYDISHNEYIDTFEDPYLAHYSYDEVCESILKDGAYSCILAVACTNSVTGKGIMTYCSPTAVSKLLSNPLTKEVRGKGVKESRECACTVMWSMMTCPKNFLDFLPNHFVLLRKKSEIQNAYIDLNNVENKGHGGVDDEHQIHINTYDGDDGLLDDPQTNDDTNDESNHDGLLDNLQKGSDANDESSHDKLLDDPQTNGDTNDEGVREGCNAAGTQPLLNNDFMNHER